jgi:hypothetical protein
MADYLTDPIQKNALADEPQQGPLFENGETAN